MSRKNRLLSARSASGTVIAKPRQISPILRKGGVHQKSRKAQRRHDAMQMRRDAYSKDFGGSTGHIGVPQIGVLMCRVEPLRSLPGSCAVWAIPG